MSLPRGAPIVHFGSLNGDEWDIAFSVSDR
jgi:hypothetical protein